MENKTLGGALISNQVLTVLLEQMRTGRFANVERLPAELELASMMEVSRTVIRDALAEMERSGYIERVRGIGTVINRDVLNQKNRLDQKLEFYEMIRSSGHTPHADSLTITMEKAKSAIAQPLGLEPGAPVLQITKRVLADSTPVIYTVDHLSPNILGKHEPDRAMLNGNIFEMLDRFGIEVTSTITHVKATVGPPAVRDALELAPTEALLMLDEVCYTRLCRPVFHSYTYYTSYFDFSLLRKKL